jgi:DNA-directed RNA polymerase specialized sigma24 family protein
LRPAKTRGRSPIPAEVPPPRARHERRKKRGGGEVPGESAFQSGDLSDGEAGLAQIVGDAPTPEFATIVAEECSRLLNQLGEDLRGMALAKMEDRTNQDIAVKLGCSLSTVERSLRLIRKVWQAEMPCKAT